MVFWLKIYQVFSGLSNGHRHDKIDSRDFFSFSDIINRYRDSCEEVLMHCNAKCLRLIRSIVY